MHDRPSSTRRSLTARTRATGFALFVLLAVALAGTPALAQESLPADIEAAIHLKVLSFDGNLPARPGDQLTLAVVYDPSDPDSVKQSAAIRAAFTALTKRAPVQNKTVHVTAIPYSASSLTADLTAQRVDIIYVCAGVQRDAVAAITAAARPRNAPTLTNTRQGLQWGLAIGVLRVDDKPKIFVNLDSVKHLGMKLNPALLRLAEVLR